MGLNPTLMERRNLLRLCRRPCDDNISNRPAAAIRRTEETAAWLKDLGYDALAYRAGMDKTVHQANPMRFQHGEAVIMVATVAFGIGIDKGVQFSALLVSES
ncbi:hypothetical protein [Aquamicrobium terrae]|uniref:Uncharacterized protein n=1 Tax=Aquamicrobium terrae TaxID=1324945 RepID=A0ABV2N832_9HYPH